MYSTVLLTAFDPFRLGCHRVIDQDGEAVAVLIRRRARSRRVLVRPAGSGVVGMDRIADVDGGGENAVGGDHGVAVSFVRPGHGPARLFGQPSLSPFGRRA
jgi:hypothetical protein